MNLERYEIQLTMLERPNISPSQQQKSRVILPSGLASKSLGVKIENGQVTGRKNFKWLGVQDRRSKAGPDIWIICHCISCIYQYIYIWYTKWCLEIVIHYENREIDIWENFSQDRSFWYMGFSILYIQWLLYASRMYILRILGPSHILRSKLDFYEIQYRALVSFKRLQLMISLSKTS